MIKDKYLDYIRETIGQYAPACGLKWFVFGSSLDKEHFNDIDLGFIGNLEKSSVRQLREQFEESTLPYNVDIVNINKTTSSFRNHVLSQNILWLQH